MIIEACVETFEEALRASQLGADRIELCSRLDLDGLTPDLKVFLKIKDQLSIPIKIMIRNRSGNFVYDQNDLKIMVNSIQSFKEYEVDGFVFGALNSDHNIDRSALKRIMENIGDIPVCFHKAFDLIEDKLEAIKFLKEVGVSEILSSGGLGPARNNIVILNSMIHEASPEINIVAAGKITKENLAWHQEHLRTDYFHGRQIV